MNKSQSRYVFGILFVFLIVLVACFIKFSDDSLTLKNVFFSVALLVVLILMIANTIHFVVHTSQGVAVIPQDEELSIKEGEQVIIFISCDSKELSEIGTDNNIIKLTGTRSGRKVFFFDITQSCGLMPSRRFRLQKAIEKNHEILFSDKDLAKINSPGIAIVVRGKVNSISTLMKHVDKKNDVIYPEIKDDGTVLLKHRYVAIATTERDLELCLQDTKSMMVDNILPEIRSKIISESQVSNGEVILNMYHVLLWYIFRSFPYNPFSTDEEKKLWLDEDDGKTALFLLKNFSLLSMTGYEEVYLPNSETAKALNDKIKWVETHMEDYETVENARILTHIFDRIKKMLYDLETRIHSYNFLYLAKNCCINSYGKLEDLIHNDLSVCSYRYIFSIASCQYGDDDVMMSNDFIHKLLRLRNFGGLIDTVQSVLDSVFFDKVIKDDMPYYHTLNIPDVLKELSIDNVKNYTFKDLVDSARKYIMKKYVVNNLPLISKQNSSKKIGCVESIILIPEEKIQVKKNNVQIKGLTESVMAFTM